MTTTTIAAITTALVLFTNPKTPDASTVQTVQDTSQVAETFDRTDSVNDIQPVNPTHTEVATDKKEQQQTKPRPVSTPTVEESQSSLTGKNNDFEPRAVNRLTSGTPTQFNVQKDESIPLPELSSAQLKSLKRQLSKYVKTDGLTRGKSTLLTVEYDDEILKVNHHELSGQLFAKYAKLLAEYEIGPGPDRRVVLDKRYIMVGDFTEDGFEGSALGRAMEIKFKENQRFTLINGLDTIPKIGTIMTANRLDEPKRKGETILKNPDSINKAGGKLSASEPLFINLPSTLDSPKNQDRYQSILNRLDQGGNDQNTVRLKSSDLRKLKRQLYKMLISDEFISSRNDNVRFRLTPSAFEVNTQNMSAGQQIRYVEFLIEYGIFEKDGHSILMNPDFILVGKFSKGEFTGSVLGTLNSERLSGGFFDEEFANNVPLQNSSSNTDSNEPSQSKTNSFVPIKVEVRTPKRDGTKNMKQFDVVPNQSFDPNLTDESIVINDSIDQAKFGTLHTELYALLLKNKDIKNDQAKGSVHFSASTLKLRGRSRSLKSLPEYTALFKKYGIGLRQDRRLLFAPKFLLLIDKEAEKRNRVWYYAKEPSEFMIYAGNSLDEMEKLTLKNN